MREQFTFYRSFADAFKHIRKDADRAKAYDAICDYALYETEPDLDSLPDSAALAFRLIKPNLDASKRKSENGKSGGRPKANESKTKANEKQNESRPKANESKTKANEKQNESKTKANESKTKANESKTKANEKQEQSGNEKENKKEIEIKNECYIPPIPPFADSPVLQTAFDNWLKYKAERRESYKPQGLQALITEIRSNADKYGANVVASLINECMASNWRGIIWEKLKRREKETGWDFRDLG